MGGFPKFPIPRYLHTSGWVVNPKWKRNVFHLIVPMALINFLIYRMAFINMYESVPLRNYVDPDSHDAARGFKL